MLHGTESHSSLTSSRSSEDEYEHLPCAAAAATLTLDNAQDIQDSYVRTRHNNLRCFPQCSPAHKTKSFCGKSLHLTLKTAFPLVREAHKTLVAEFRNQASPRTFAGVGATCNAALLDNEDEDDNANPHPHLFQGAPNAEFHSPAFAELPLESRWVLNPPRKWRYEGRTSSLDLHVLTMYVVYQNRVVAVVDSPPFRVVPIWRMHDDSASPSPSPKIATLPRLSAAPAPAVRQVVKRQKKAAKEESDEEAEEHRRAVQACLALNPGRHSPPVPLPLPLPPTSSSAFTFNRYSNNNGGGGGSPSASGTFSLYSSAALLAAQQRQHQPSSAPTTTSSLYTSFSTTSSSTSSSLMLGAGAGGVVPPMLFNPLQPAFIPQLLMPSFYSRLPAAVQAPPQHHFHHHLPPPPSSSSSQ